MSPDPIETTIRQAILDQSTQGFSIKPGHVGIIFSPTKGQFVRTLDYCCPLCAVIMTKDNDPQKLKSLAELPENEPWAKYPSERVVVANILETKKEFVDGFIDGFDGFAKAIQSPTDATITIADMLYSRGWDLGNKLRTELLNKRD
ncbi:MAG: hypothetical protein ACLP0A_11540 [Verrucomicrobiia bacterium]